MCPKATTIDLTTFFYLSFPTLLLKDDSHKIASKQNLEFEQLIITQLSPRTIASIRDKP